MKRCPNCRKVDLTKLAVQPPMPIPPPQTSTPIVPEQIVLPETSVDLRRTLVGKTIRIRLRRSE